MERFVSIKSKISLTLDLPPSCIEVCRDHPSYFVVGTYFLEEASEGRTEDTSPEKNPQMRNGSLLAFCLVDDIPTLVQTCLQPSAILDIRFHVSEGRKSILAVISSTGTLSIFRFDPIVDAKKPMRHLKTSRCDDLGENIMFLQCQWQPYTPENNIGVTTSTGQSRLLILGDDWGIKSYVKLNIGNTLEAWSLAFAPETSLSAQGEMCQVVYSGGDDSVLRYTTCQSHQEETWSAAACRYPAILVRGQHQAGVTAILPLTTMTPSGGRLVFTGSYDDTIRLFSIQDPHKVSGAKDVQFLADCNVGGGVWRLNLIDVVESSSCIRVRVLASCMYAGARIVAFQRRGEGERWEAEELAKFEEHESMNYCSDFIIDSEMNAGTLKVISTSFYDKLLCLWLFTDES